MKGQLRSRRQQSLPDAQVFMDLMDWVSASSSPEEASRHEVLGTPDPRTPRLVSPKCLRLANIFFFRYGINPKPFGSFYKNEICIEWSDLNKKPTGFGWLWCFPKVEEKHIRDLGPCLFCFRGSIFLWDHSKLGT